MHARRTACLNNQHELSLGIMQYEVNKQHFPAGIASSGTQNWCTMILPYIDRGDLWYGTSGTASSAGWVTGSGTAVFLKQFVCPDDMPPGGTTTPALDYVTNANVFAPSATPPTMTQVKTKQQTVMLSERLQYGVPSGSTLVTGPWTCGQPAYIMAVWPPTTDATPLMPRTLPVQTSTQSGLVVSSNHPGLIVVTFFDGHADAIPDDTPANTYLPGP